MSERTGTFRLLEQSGGGASGSIPAISEQRFVVNRMGRTIPGVVWMPQRVSDRVPLVLVQHGGSGHKADASVLAFVRQLSALYGFAAAAIDGPLHGERRSHGTEASVMLAEFLAYWEEGPDIESYVEEWRSVIDSLSKFDRVDADRIGWYGPSMGTVYGMPLLARESRVKAAVLGKWSAYHANSRHLVEVASHVSSPTLFVQHWDDELFDREGTMAVFDAIGAADKRLYVYPGKHAGRSADELDASLAHLASRLGSLSP